MFTKQSQGWVQAWLLSITPPANAWHVFRGLQNEAETAASPMGCLAPWLSHLILAAKHQVQTIWSSKKLYDLEEGHHTVLHVQKWNN